MPKRRARSYPTGLVLLMFRKPRHLSSELNSIAPLVLPRPRIHCLRVPNYLNSVPKLSGMLRSPSRYRMF